MTQPIYLLTGAAGHLGTAVVRELQGRGARIRALVLPQERDAAVRALGSDIEMIEGDVCDSNSLVDFFSNPEGAPLYVIHMAGIVSIQSKKDDRVREVNVNGTKNVVALCRAYGVQRLVYVSSVHAIRELPRGQRMAEAGEFNPRWVNGYYAKTKAEATQVVLDAAKAGLNASVVHPSGIVGPYDSGHGHVNQMIVDYARGTLSAGVNGGYDFVDVRDVAAGVVNCCTRGRAGECYILSNRYITVREMFDTLSDVTGRRRVRAMLPLWLATAVAPLAELYYKLLRQPPLFTGYSMYTLHSNALFSHAKADRELGYSTRPFEDTLRDTVQWMREQGRIAKAKAARLRRKPARAQI